MGHIGIYKLTMVALISMALLSMTVAADGVTCEKSDGGKALGRCLDACAQIHPGKGVSVGGCSLSGNTYTCDTCEAK